MGENAGMREQDAATLSSMSQLLDDVLDRIGTLVERYATAEREDLMAALHEAERLTRSAGRELTRVSRLL